MEHGTTIRLYDAGRDSASLRACIVEHQDFHRGLEPSWPEGTAIADDYMAYLETQCAAHDGCVVVAERAEQIVGFVCVVASTRGESPDDPATFAWIHDLFVKAGHRRHGIATVLMKEAESFARAHGAPLLRLGVLDRNEGARAFYRRHGFRDYVRVLAKALD
jgi:GNAT superfamily N-acetyltransferase